MSAAHQERKSGRKDISGGSKDLMNKCSVACAAHGAAQRRRRSDVALREQEAGAKRQRRQSPVVQKRQVNAHTVSAVSMPHYGNARSTRGDNADKAL